MVHENNEYNPTTKEKNEALRLQGGGSSPKEYRDINGQVYAAINAHSLTSCNTEKEPALYVGAPNWRTRSYKTDENKK